MTFKVNQSVEVVGTGTEHDGKIWRVVGKAPNKAFKLPNGRMHANPKSKDAWVVEMAAPIHVPTSILGMDYTMQFTNNYGVCDAKYLEALND